MPRQSQKRIKGSKRVHEQDTFDFTQPRMDVSARRVDAFANPGQDRKGSTILKFVGQLQGMSGAYQRDMKRIEGEDHEAGQTSAMRGEEAPEDASAAFIEGHERFTGSADANAYHKQMEELYQKQYQLTPDQWLAEKEKINAEFLNGRSDAYVQGFVPAAVKIEDNYDRRYQKQQMIMVQDEYLTNVSANAELSLDLGLKDETMSGQDVNISMRQSLTTMQETGKQYGLSRTEVSKVFLRSIGEKAAQTGRPDLLNFAMIPDKDGHKLSNRPDMADIVNNYIQAAEAEQESMVQKKLGAEKKLQKEIDVSIDRALVVSTESGDFGDAKALIRQYADNLTPERLATHIKRIKALESEEGWSTTSNPMEYQAFYNLSAAGEMDDNAWEMARYSLSKAEYKEMVKLNTKAKEDAENPKAPSRANLKQYTNLALNKVAPKDNITKKYFNENGADREQFVVHQFNLRFEERTADKKAGPVTIKELREWSKDIEADAEAQFPIGGEAATVDTPSKSSPTAKVNPVSKSKPMTNKSAGDPIVKDLDDLFSRIDEAN